MLMRIQCVVGAVSMTRKVSLAILVVGFLVASSFVGTAAFTSASVARDTTATVATDDAAIVGLNPGTADGAELNADGELVVYPEGSGENGLNKNAVFEYGDGSSASAAASSHGFTVTNNDDVAHDFTLSYSQSAGDGTMTYKVAYDSTGGSSPDTLVTVDSATSQTLTLQSGQTAYVVVIADTGTNDIDGTFSIDAA